MERTTKWVLAATFALAFLSMGTMLLLDWLQPIETISPNWTSTSVEAGKETFGKHPAQAPGVDRKDSVKTPDHQPPPTTANETVSAASAPTESVALLAERRRLARALFEEFRKSGNAAPDSETTSHPALFLPNGKPVDPYMLPPLQLPASMTIENPEIEITTDFQVGEWEGLQDEFIAEVDGKLPTDPESRKIWIQAQRKNDEQFRLKFGTEAFLRQKIDAYREGFLQN